MTDDAFVDRAYLLAHLTDARVRIVDARSVPHGVAIAQTAGKERYAAGHIPGAVHVDYHDDLRDPATPYAARVAPPERFAAVVGALGIGEDTTVIAYDDGDVPYAARIVWMLRYYGHDAAYVLAGGLAEWRAHDGAVTTDMTSYAAATFTPRTRPELRATREEVLAIARGQSDTQLVETQRDRTYGMRDRDITGAVRLSGSQLLDDANGGRIAPRETLDALIATTGLDRAKRTIVSCGSGVSASGSYLALRTAGFTDVAVYDGSWMEWSHDDLPAVPKAER